MALTFQGLHKEDVDWALARTIEVRQQGTGSFVSVGAFRDFAMTIDALTRTGDPANTEYVYAVEYSGSFNLLQSDRTKELAMLAGVAGTGLFDTDVEIKVTFASGRVITLGAVSGYPLRLIPGYVTGREDDAAIIPCRFANREPVSSVGAKVA